MHPPQVQLTRSLAILPFRNSHPDPATDFLGYSLADAVITKMGYISSLNVRPSSSIDRYRNLLQVNPRQAAADLNVDTLLLGTYLKDGNDLRINMQLEHFHVNCNQLWKFSADANAEDVFR